MDPFQSLQVRLFYGKAMLIIRSETKNGEIIINANSNGLVEDSKIIDSR